jgi:hypothetical chaperone protein
MSRSIGLDFGTTNSALALAEADGSVSLARFTQGNGTTDTFRSILYFDPHDRDRRGRPVALAGPQAIARYLAGDGGGRLMQSLKSQLASRLFHSTMIAGRTWTLEELIAVILASLRAEAETRVGPLGSRVVCGRPVRFTHAETPEDDAFAVERLRAAMAAAGFEHVVFEYEPVAAAYHYERSLDHDELVLIADFGGGTSDFCLVRVGPSVRGTKRKPSDILGTEGVALAGDAFDSEIVSHVVSPALGLDSRYVLPMDQDGKTMPIPPWIYQKLRRWHHLSFLKSKETKDLLEELRKQALEPQKIEALIHLVEADLGFHLYKAVERTKVELSRDTQSRFVFEDPPIELDARVERRSFDEWIGHELRQIEACVDRLLDRTRVPRSAVDRVFLTGGSSLVPAVRGLFAARFGEHKLRAGDELTSVALGLSLRARDEDAS